MTLLSDCANDTTLRLCNDATLRLCNDTTLRLCNDTTLRLCNVVPACAARSPRAPQGEGILVLKDAGDATLPGGRAGLFPAERTGAEHIGAEAGAGDKDADNDAPNAPSKVRG
eukprot:8507870-Pyramimonas_sp.AAC.1